MQPLLNLPNNTYPSSAPNAGGGIFSVLYQLCIMTNQSLHTAPIPAWRRDLAQYYFWASDMPPTTELFSLDRQFIEKRVIDAMETVRPF